MGEGLGGKGETRDGEERVMLMKCASTKGGVTRYKRRV